MAPSDELLFPASLIPSDALALLPQPQTGSNYTIRPLQRDDQARGFLECLAVLTHVGELSEARFQDRFDQLVAAKGTYYVLVVESEGRIVGTGNVFVERTFIHDLGNVGHIEQISFLESHQGKGLGKALMASLDGIARNVGCYKSILVCGPRTEPFYSKCGYHSSGTEMSHYYEEQEDNYHRG